MGDDRLTVRLVRRVWSGPGALVERSWWEGSARECFERGTRRGKRRVVDVDLVLQESRSSHVSTSHIAEESHKDAPQRSDRGTPPRSAEGTTAATGSRACA